ncbi:MAG TPA: dihydrodipicolinate synthase family protein [bacterium]|nr:dihydrodipicolinate synthase family protein [bacterium]
MTETTQMRGVLSPVITPFKADLTPDANRLIAQCRWLLSQNVGLAVFGTNSEANSLSVDEKLMLLDMLVEAGLDPKRMMPGTGACALSDSVRLTKRAVELGCGGALMLPPFYYKGVSDEGLFRNFAEVIERVGDDRLRIYLYHIPPVSQVPITLGLIDRLLKAYPGIVAGVKDSSGDWNNTKAMLDAFPGFGVFAGQELMLLDNMRNGGVGCISATANVNPGPIHQLYANWESSEADRMQADVAATRKFIQQFPMIPSLKQIVAHYSGDAGWARLRPPLVELTAELSTKLLDGLAERNFAMPGLPKVQKGAAD